MRRAEERNRLAVLVFFFTALGAGCGGASGGGGGGAGGAGSASSWCEVTLEAWCARQVGCGVALENEATTVASCVAEGRASCEPELQAWVNSVEAGRAGFDAEALSACVSGIEGASCRELSAGYVPAACGGVFVGSGVAGGACYTSVECGEGLGCATAGRCPGVCAASAAPEPAAGCEVVGCGAGSYCNGTRCQPLRGEGEACEREGQCGAGQFCGKDVGAPELLCRGQHGEGEVCFARAACAGERGCLLAGEVRRCGAAKGAGELCADSEECGAGLGCELSTGRCAAPLAEGEGCVTSGSCAAGLYCWLDRPGGAVCREEGKVGVEAGALCNPALDRCVLGHYCRIGDGSPEVGSCAALPELGEPCEAFERNLNGECRVGACLRLEGEALCRSLREPGEACATRAECRSGACVEEVCAPYGALICGFAP